MPCWASGSPSIVTSVSSHISCQAFRCSSSNVPAQAFGFARFRYGFLYQVLPFIIKGRRDADIFDERCGIARFHLDAYAESGLFLFFYAYGVGKCLFIVLEEPVGHGIACLCVFPPGLCPQIGTITGSAGSEDIPYLFIRMLGMLRNVSVESRYEGNFPCIVKEVTLYLIRQRLGRAISAICSTCKRSLLPRGEVTSTSR